MSGTLQKPTKHYDVTTTLFHYHIFSLSKPKKNTMKSFINNMHYCFRRKIKTNIKSYL